jgi:biotin operon repressor
MEFGKPPEHDPTIRRRLDWEAMLRRDEQVAALRREGVSLRKIGAELGMSLASVQLAMKRIEKRGVPAESPNPLQLYRALRGLSGPQQAPVLEEFRRAAEYRKAGNK